MFSEPDPYFSLFVFFKELFINLTNPFCIPFLENSVIRFSFAWGSWRGITYNYVSNLLFWYIIMESLVGLFRGGNGEHYFNHMSLPFLCFLGHRLLIALKYATLHPTEYNRLMGIFDVNLCVLLQTQAQLLTGYIKSDPTVLNFDIKSTCYDLAVNPDDMCFRFHSIEHKKMLVRFLRSVNINHKDVVERHYNRRTASYEYAVTLRTFIIAVSRAGQNNKANYDVLAGRFTNFFLLLVCVCILNDSYWAIKRYREKVGTGPYVDGFTVHFIIFQLAVLTLTYIMYPLFNFFLYAVFSEFNRRKELAVCLRDMIRLTDRIPGAPLDIDEDYHPHLQGLLYKQKSYNLESPVLETADSEVGKRNVHTGNGASMSVTETEEDADWDADFDDIDQFAKPDYYQEEDLPEGWGPNTGSLDDTSESSRNVSINVIGAKGDITKVSDDAKEHFRSKARDGNPSQILLPRLDICLSGNISAWTFLRSYFQSNAKRWTARMDTYIGAFIISFIIMILYLSIRLFENYAHDGSLAMYFRQPMIGANLVLAFNVFIWLLFVVVTGAMANYEFEKHRHLLGLNSIHIEAKIATTMQKYESKINRGYIPTESENFLHNRDLSQLAEISNSCNRMEEFVDMTNNITPLRVMGVPATFSLATTIVTVFGTFVTSLIGSYAQE